MRLQKKSISIASLMGLTVVTVFLFQNCNPGQSFHSSSGSTNNTSTNSNPETKREIQSVSDADGAVLCSGVPCDNSNLISMPTNGIQNLPAAGSTTVLAGSNSGSQLPSNTPSNISGGGASVATNQGNSQSGCSFQLQSIGWSEKQDVTVETWAVDYDNFLVGVNQRVDRHAGFSVLFRSSIYTQPWAFKSNVEMPSGFGVRITDKATGQEIPIREDDLMGSPQYPSATHPVMGISTYKTPSQQGSHVSVAFRRLFFSRENLAFKTLKFDLLCDNKVIASGDKNMFTEPFSKNMLDVYMLDSTGAYTLTNREGHSYRYILVDRSIDGGSLLITCPVRLANEGQTITCNLKSDTISISKWYVDNTSIQAYDNKQTLALSNLARGTHSVKVKGTSVNGYEVESNIISLDIK